MPDLAKRCVLGCLNQQLHKLGGECVGFVIMPNHVHAAVQFSRPTRLYGFMQQWKRQSSYRCRQAGIDTATSRRFWTPKYDSFEIFTEAKLAEKLNYMHLDPIRAGFVQQPEDQLWSSARWWSRRQSVGVPLSWPGVAEPISRPDH